MLDLELEKRIKKSDETPLLIIDFHVMLWKVISFFEEATMVYKKNKEVIAKIGISYILNRGPLNLKSKDYRIIVIADNRSKEYDGYWRHHEVSLDNRIQEAWNNYNPRKKNRSYKGGRGDKTETFYYIYDIARNYCEEYLNFYEFNGFEADDIAGALYRSELKKQTKRPKIFFTVDRDWCQLIDEDLGFYWYTPRIPRSNEMFLEQAMDNTDVLLYAEKKLDLKIDHPSNLVIAKVAAGDLGDNLPPGTPLEYMDLINPHPKYNIETLFPNEFNKLVEDAMNYEPNNKLEHLKECEKLFKKLNLNFNYSG